MLQKMKSCLKGKKQKGISLLEVLLSLTIISVILVMATRYYFEASASAKAASTAQLIVGIQSEINKDANHKVVATAGTLIARGFLLDDTNGSQYETPLGKSDITFPQAIGGDITVNFGSDAAETQNCARVAIILDGSSCSGGLLTVTPQA